MNKKNPIRWSLGIIIILIMIVSGTQVISKYMLSSSRPNINSPYSFFQFLASCFGFGTFNNSSNNSFYDNNSQNQNNLYRGKSDKNHQSNDENPISLPNEGILTSQGTLKNEQVNGNENAPGINNENGLGNSEEINSEKNADQGTVNVSETNSIDNSTNNSIDNSVNSTGIYPADSSTNADNNSENSSMNNFGNTTTASGGGASTDNSGSNSGGDTGSNSGSNSGNNPVGPDPASLPTINPIPSDSTISQTTSKQNQNNDSVAALIASRQALVVPVQQEAQETKYQTVDSQNIQPPSTNEPPPDVQEKVRLHQLTLH